jgi:hypothetical protein
MNLLKDFNPDL